ncbi:head GIN domain-containing protein [Chryseobacterium echinoideorum]|uniref:head GIN domain-containing protein n=1 Tax=Chryseobacterium echinoideorum TaxID=1549648 RepID=UPI001185B46A|nr:head GIN domain-containing protein [Chryseobacterium echinoideorum]
MKCSAILLFSGLVLMASCNKNDNREQKNNWLPDITNSDHGPLKQKEFAGDFDEIEVSQAIEAEVIKSDVEKVVISAPANIIDEVLVDNDGTELHIHYKRGFRVINSTKVKAKIYTKDFIKLVANSAADIVVKDQFTQDKTDLEVSSSGQISGKLEANELTIDAASSGSFTGKIWAVNLSVEASSAGTVEMSGKAKSAELKASSGSDISAKEMTADLVKAESSSGASIEVGVVSKFEGHASSGGSVNGIKKGNVTTIAKEESSGGSVSLQ